MYAFYTEVEILQMLFIKVIWYYWWMDNVWSRRVLICLILFQVLNKVLRQEIFIQSTANMISQTEAFVLRVSRTSGHGVLLHSMGEVLQYVLYLTVGPTTLV